MRRYLKARWLMAAALSALAAGAIASPASAGIWTEVPSGTASTITAIEYQSDTRLWFTTASGQVWRRRADLSGFAIAHPGGPALNDIEFQAGGDIGFAVGIAGTVLRSTNGGATWSPVAGIPVSNLGDGSGNQCTRTEPLGAVNFVRFAGNGRVWIGGPDRQIATSQPGDPAQVGAPGTWIDANRKPVPVAFDNCWIDQREGFADMFVTPSPDAFYVATGEGDSAFYSPSNLTSAPLTPPAEIANGFGLAGALAGDPASPNRMWATSPAPYGNSTTQYTDDGWSTSRWVTLDDTSGHGWPPLGPYDLAFKDGTVLAAGNGGFVIHSTNGRNFFWNGADGAVATNDWRAVALASATQGAVGGADGRLVLTTQANVLPIPPVLPPTVPPTAPPTTPPIAPRTPTTPRAPTTRPVGRGGGGGAGRGGTTAPPNVSGRSATQTTGGARLTTWKQVALSRGRYVPVRISARTPRRFVIEVRRAKRPRTRIAMSKARLGRNGRALVRVPLRRSTRTGRYRIVVRVYKGRRAIGRRVDVAFLIVR